MLSISKDQIAPFLHATAFYQALEEGDGQRFEVPKHCYKVDFTLKTEADVVLLIDTIRFWGLEGTPKELVAYVLKKDYFNWRALFNGAETDLKYLKLLSELQLTDPDHRINVAMKSGDLVVLQYLFENDHTWRDDSMNYAATEGHLECMKYAHENGCSWGKYTMEYIAKSGHLECMKYAHESGCEWTRHTFAYVAGGGDLESLKYALANGCPNDLDADLNEDHLSIESAIFVNAVYVYGACANAAHKGHLAMLKYLHTHNLAVWDSNTCAAAAAAGQLECLKYAHENGCAWNASTTALAAQYWGFNCFDYAMIHGCPHDTRAIFYMSIADHPDTHRLLREQCQDKPMLIVKTASEFMWIVVSWVLMCVCGAIVFFLVGWFYYTIITAMISAVLRCKTL